MSSKQTIQETDPLRPFLDGNETRAWRLMGSHPDGQGYTFRVWAPNAKAVSLVGDFNGWNAEANPMNNLFNGVWQCHVDGLNRYDTYKYAVEGKSGKVVLKADPYAFHAETRPGNASKIYDLAGYEWGDQAWLDHRRKNLIYHSPANIYELHLGSWRRNESNEFLSYRDIADQLAPSLQEMGFTHVELMPVTEHPLDMSWGYQCTGYFAATSRFGTPHDFMYFVDRLHQAGVGVILDWVPAHFPRDTYGMSNFDGTCLYEHLDPRQGFHPHWGTLIYNYGRPQVSNYLIANALFWVEKYHADGIRMDAVASMLYLDYGKNDGEWVANMYGGKENLEAMEMIKHLNSIMKKRNPGVLSIAEESTAFPKITGAVEDDGLGFDLKWNMGFMNDYLQYIQYDPYFRSHHHGELTFSMIYAYSEHFMLVFSHDEVVHGKATMLGKMPGEREQKFANLRLTYGYMMTHPGKKLLFMGQDLGEFDEWNENRTVQWELRKVEDHAGISRLVSDLNHLYRTRPELSVLDDSPEGFEWINHVSAQDCYLTYARRGKDPEQILVVAANFAGIPQEITTGVPYEGKYKEILNTDDTKYGGTGAVNSRLRKTKPKECDGRHQSITVKLAPLSLSILEFIPFTEEELEKEIERRIRENVPVRKADKKAGAAKKVAAARKADPSKAEMTETKAEPVKNAETTGKSTLKKAEVTKRADAGKKAGTAKRADAAEKAGTAKQADAEKKAGTVKKVETGKKAETA